MLKLEDLKPEPSSFTLDSNGKTYHLRPVSLDDELWLRKTFGDRLQEVFTNLEMENLSRIVFHQLTPADQCDFLPEKRTFINEEGHRFEETVGGYRLLMVQMQGGVEEKVRIIDALLKTIGASRPKLEAAAGGGGEAQKKSPPKKPTGPRSSKTSRRPTAGTPKKSSRSRHAK